MKLATLLLLAASLQAQTVKPATPVADLYRGLLKNGQCNDDKAACQWMMAVDWGVDRGGRIRPFVRSPPAWQAQIERGATPDDSILISTLPPPTPGCSVMPGDELHGNWCVSHIVLGMPGHCTITRSYGEQRLTCWYRPIPKPSGGK